MNFLISFIADIRRSRRFMSTLKEVDRASITPSAMDK